MPECEPGNQRSAGIQPHSARLRIRTRDILTVGVLDGLLFEKIGDDADAHIALKLDGMMVEIGNPAGPEFTSSAHECIPHLGALTPSLGGASPAAAFGDPTIIKSYFDFLAGDLVGWQNCGGAAVSVLTAFTGGDVLITLNQFHTGNALGFRLKQGASIIIENVPDSTTLDSDNDFFLSYLVANEFPNDPKAPTSISCPIMPDCLTPPGPADPRAPDGFGLGYEFTITVSCSNSNYP